MMVAWSGAYQLALEEKPVPPAFGAESVRVSCAPVTAAPAKSMGATKLKAFPLFIWIGPKWVVKHGELSGSGTPAGGLICGRLAGAAGAAGGPGVGPVWRWQNF